MRRINGLLALVLSAAAFGVAIAQDQVPAEHAVAATAPKPEEHYYKLTFRVIERGNDKSTPISRAYSTIVRSPDDMTCQIRTKDAFRRAIKGDDAKVASIPYDVGTSIDVRRLMENDGSLDMRVIVSVDQIPVGSTDREGIMQDEPLTRQSKWDSYVVVPIGKPTIIFSSDNIADTGKTELELTGTLIH